MLTEKIALITKIIMEKAEEKAEDFIIDSECDAEHLAASELSGLKEWHREHLRETVQEALEEAGRITARACSQQFRNNLFARQKQVEKVRKAYAGHLREIRLDRGKYTRIL